MLKSELIEQNKNLIIQNGKLMYLLEFGELRSEDSNHQMIWKHDSNARVLQNRIERAIKYIENNSPNLSNSEIYELLEILKGETNE